MALRFAGNNPQAKTLIGVKGGGFQPAIIKHETFRARALNEQVTIVTAGDGIRKDIRSAGDIERQLGLGHAP